MRRSAASATVRAWAARSAVKAFHSSEEGEEKAGDTAHVLVGGVDRQQVGQRAGPCLLAAQVMDEVEYFTQIAAEPVERVHHNGVPGAGVGEQVSQAGTLDGGPALLVHVDPHLGDARLTW